MAEALGLASSVTGIISLGISVCQGLVQYYSSWKDQKSDISATLASISALSSSLELLKTSIEGKKFDGKIVENVKNSIESCEGGVLALQKKLGKIGEVEKVDLKSKVHDMGRRALYPFRESTLVKLREIVDDVRANLAIALDALHLHLVGVTADKLDQLSEKVGDVGIDIIGFRGVWEAFTNDQESQLCLEWISTMNFYSMQADMLNRRQEGTGEWLFQSEEFQTWLTGAEKTLWCSGSPGSGKTILAAAVVDTLGKTMISPDIGLAYIYCNYKEQASQSLVNLLGSIIQQLIRKRGQMPNDVFAMYKIHKSQGTRPTRAEYSKMLRSIASTFSQVYIVIDALDECDEASGTRVNLTSEFTNKAANWQLICTSRHLGDIEQIFAGSSHLEIRASDEDVRIYLKECIKSESRLSQFCKKDPILEDLIIQNISENAKGMFLLAQLHIQSVARRLTVKAVRKALKNLPEKLDDTYDDAIERIRSQNEDKAELALRLLSWISYASRPLEVREVQHAMAVMDLDDDDDEDDEADLTEDDLHAKDLLITICAGIVTIDKDSNIMRLVHFTAQEYFIRNRAEIFPTASVDIPAACLKYLSLGPLRHGYCQSNEDMVIRLETHPLLRYAASEWGNHARGKAEDTFKEVIIAYLSNESLRRCWSQLESLTELRYGDWSQQFVRNNTPVTIAAYFGLTETIKLLLENGGDPNRKGDNSLTPLMIAASRGHEDTVKLLLGRGADVAARGKKHYHGTTYNQDLRGTTALHEAARYGSESVIKVLLENGSDVQAFGNGNKTAAMLAVANGHVESINVLLRHARESLSALAFREHEGQCLLEAATAGNESIVLAILKIDPNAGRLIPWGQSALQAAAANSYPAIVTLLLNSGAEINHSHHHDYVYGSVLQAACVCGSLSLIKELLNKGANVNSHSGSDGSPLQAAVAYSTEDKEVIVAIVKVLLENGANVNARGGSFGSALHAASARGFAEIVELLLMKDADINMHSGPYSTALQAATRRKEESVVRLLIKKNAEVTDQAKALLKHAFPETDFFPKPEEVVDFPGGESILEKDAKNGLVSTNSSTEQSQPRSEERKSDAQDDKMILSSREDANADANQYLELKMRLSQ